MKSTAIALLIVALLVPPALSGTGPAKSGRVTTLAPTKPPLVSVEVANLPEGTDRLDLYLLIGQSNMKGRGFMPEEPKNDPRIIMMHLRDDQWYRARHPLHLTGDAKTFAGHDNAGVGPGLAFAEAVAEAGPEACIGLIPSARGGSAIQLWSETGQLYVNAVRRTRLALAAGPEGKTKLRGVLWLQGEADAKEDRIGKYPAALADLVDRLRKDFDDPELPFLAATIGEITDRPGIDHRKEINQILLDLPNQRKNTAAVDARNLKGHIGDSVHYDTPTQEEIGRRFAAKFLALADGEKLE